ncbi:fluoride efflux transporter CrcB [Flexilinea flocculi]|jgi:CrcB protein|uniref:Fluoride-specific ion channel FluC n=1 Tax=Flexilinea flocculi TaxID=1678840 RepID=A0A0S7BK62_9CHLR|nr:fluoride efflux transporter CrcB [Flexilinea flocculi]NMB93488.1 fluoride efflux transporter CrcB [Flexilinea flocculi]GAP40733.1 protein CrcB [Flexilinea flocculi]
MKDFIMIAIGAVFGANARYWIGSWAAQKFGIGFPFGTLLINFSGSLLLGFFITIATERFSLDPQWRLLISVGFFGAYTTFSTFTLDSIQLLIKGQWFYGLFNLFGSTMLGVLAAGVGIWLAKNV